jgi:hypothetical protein
MRIAGTDYILHPPACYRCHTKGVAAQPMSSMHLRIFEYEAMHREEKFPPTYKSPGIASFVDVHPRGVDICRVTEVRKPHIFDMKVVKCLLHQEVDQRFCIYEVHR